MRMQMQNIKRPLPLPLLPEWWTGDDENNRNVAQRGCQMAAQNCTRCAVEVCPESLRLCRVCAYWGSAIGRVGMCEKDGRVVKPGHGCSKWGARI